MPHGIVAAGLEDVEEADDVRLDVDVRVRDRIAHARLRGEVDDDVELFRFKELEHERLVRHVALEEAVSVVPAEDVQPGILQVDVVVIVHAVEPDDLVPLLQQTHSEMHPDKTGSAGD